MDNNKLNQNLKKVLFYIDKLGKTGKLRQIRDVEDFMKMVDDKVRQYKDIGLQRARRVTQQAFGEALTEEDLKEILALIREADKDSEEPEVKEPEVEEPAPEEPEEENKGEEKPDVVLQRLMNSAAGSNFLDSVNRMTPTKKRQVYLSLIKSLPDILSPKVRTSMQSFFRTSK